MRSENGNFFTHRACQEDWESQEKRSFCLFAPSITFWHRIRLIELLLSEWRKEKESNRKRFSQFKKSYLFFSLLLPRSVEFSSSITAFPHVADGEQLQTRIAYRDSRSRFADFYLPILSPTEKKRACSRPFKLDCVLEGSPTLLVFMGMHHSIRNLQFMTLFMHLLLGHLKSSFYCFSYVNIQTKKNDSYNTFYLL